MRYKKITKRVERECIMKKLCELGQEYLESAAMLRAYANELCTERGSLSQIEQRLLLAKTADMKKTAALLKKYGLYLCRYYERGERQ